MALEKLKRFFKAVLQKLNLSLREETVCVRRDCEGPDKVVGPNVIVEWAKALMRRYELNNVKTTRCCGAETWDGRAEAVGTALMGVVFVIFIEIMCRTYA